MAKRQLNESRGTRSATMCRRGCVNDGVAATRREFSVILVCRSSQFVEARLKVSKDHAQLSRLTLSVSAGS